MIDKNGLKMIKIKVDASELNELLLDVMLQCCGLQEEDVIDNQCLSAYEDACDYLTEQGYLTTLNGRIYKLKKRRDE